VEALATCKIWRIKEQNTRFAIAMSSRYYILEKGKNVHGGNTAEISGGTIIKYPGTQ
jgi:ABC-type branched-subunit amino acid transport system ATPase component